VSLSIGTANRIHEWIWVKSTNKQSATTNRHPIKVWPWKRISNEKKEKYLLSIKAWICNFWVHTIIIINIISGIIIIIVLQHVHQTSVKKFNWISYFFVLLQSSQLSYTSTFHKQSINLFVVLMNSLKTFLFCAVVYRISTMSVMWTMNEILISINNNCFKKLIFIDMQMYDDRQWWRWQMELT
jgi:hypothetical protein